MSGVHGEREKARIAIILYTTYQNANAHASPWQVALTNCLWPKSAQKISHTQPSHHFTPIEEEKGRMMHQNPISVAFAKVILNLNLTSSWDVKTGLARAQCTHGRCSK
jgi:hypothetical protein